MRFDTLTEFSVAQTLSGTSADSTNTIDLAGAGIAEGQCFVVATLLANCDEDAAVELQGSDDNSSFVALAKRAFPTGNAGDQIAIPVPPGCPRYLKLKYTATALAGSVSAGLTLSAQSTKGIEQYAAN